MYLPEINLFPKDQIALAIEQIKIWGAYYYIYLTVKLGLRRGIHAFFTVL